MTIPAFDVDSYNKPGFDFGTAYAQGYRAGYIKLGGDNDSDGRYVGTSNGGYQGQFNAFCAAGFQHRGSYWLSGRHDPAASARFYLANRDPRTTFDVLDNETLDDGNEWSPSEAYTFHQVLHDAGLRDLWMYASRLGPWASDDYSALANLGVKALVADYGTSPLGAKIFTIRYPSALVKGHQFTSSASIGGLAAIDENVFTDDAFTVATPAPVIHMKRRNTMFGFLRNKDDGGSIYLIDGEHGTYRGLSGGEWAAYAAAGAKYADASNAQVKEALGRLKAA